MNTARNVVAERTGQAYRASFTLPGWAYDYGCPYLLSDEPLQELANWILCSYVLNAITFDKFDRDALAEQKAMVQDLILAREASIDEILDLLDAHHHSRRWRLIACDGRKSLFLMLINLGRHYPLRAPEIVARACEIFYTEDPVDAYAAQEIFSLIGALRCCPEQFLPALARSASSSDPEYAARAQYALAASGPEGREVIKHLANSGVGNLSVGIVSAVSCGDVDFTALIPYVVAHVTDTFAKGCSCRAQHAAAAFGEAIWPALFERYATDTAAASSKTIPIALALIGRPAELIELFGKTPSNQAAILRAIPLMCLDVVQFLGKNIDRCSMCLRYRRLEDINGVFAWAIELANSEDDTVRHAAWTCLLSLLKDGRATEAQLGAAADLLVRLSGESDPNEQAWLMSIVEGLAPRVPDSLKQSLGVILHAIWHSLGLRCSFRRAFEERFFSHRHRQPQYCGTGPTHYRPENIPEAVAEVKSAIEQIDPLHYRYRLLTALLSTLENTQAREAAALKAMVG